MKPLFWLILFYSQFSFGTTYYVASTGSDSNNGLDSLHPFLTISKAATIIPSLGAGDTVRFKRGDTFFGSIQDLPSGAANNRFVITDYSSRALSKPVFVGSVALTSWTAVSGQTNIWEASLNSGLFLDLVTVNGVMIPMGRTPDGIGSGYYNVDSHSGGTQITSTSIGTPSYVGAYVVMRTRDYVTDRNLITGQSGTTITFLQTGANVISDNSKFFFQGAMSTLNLQNEWYYNSTAHTLRMYSTVNPSTLNVKAGTQTYGISDDFASYVKISNIAFTGYDSIAIRLDHADSTVVDSCDFEFIGSDVFSTFIGVGARISNNTLRQIGNSGVVTRYGSGVYIINNKMDSLGIIEGMGLGNNNQREGIMHENADYNSGHGDKLLYNKINYTGNSAIRFSGAGTEVGYNYINEFGSQASDGSGIGTCCNAGLARRSLHDNVVRNGHGQHLMSADPTEGGMPGIYLDDGTGNMEVYNNTVEKVTRYNFYCHGCTDINVYNNTFYGETGVEANVGAEDDNLNPKLSGLNIFSNTMYISPTGRNIKFLTYGTADDNPINLFGSLYNNIYSRTTGTGQFEASPGGTYNLATWYSTYGWDGASTLVTVNKDSVKLFYNELPTTVVKTFTGFTYRDLLLNNFTDNMTLAPFQSKIATKVTNIPPTSGGTLFIIPHAAGRVVNKIKIN